VKAASPDSEITLEGGAPDFARPTSRLEVDGTYTIAGFPDPKGRAPRRWLSPPNFGIWAKLQERPSARPPEFGHFEGYPKLAVPVCPGGMLEFTGGITPKDIVLQKRMPCFCKNLHISKGVPSFHQQAKVRDFWC
jgi:hypothetical protein